jgi:hypothetical protein
VNDQQAPESDPQSPESGSSVEKKKRKGKRRRGRATAATKPARPTRSYPKVPLQKALAIVHKIKELNGGNAWTPAQIAEAIEMGARSPDFYYVTAASRDFGLTTGTRETATIALTDLGRELVYAASPEVEQAKKVEAFHRVDLFGKVLQHYKGSNLPEMKYLGNTLEREFKLAPEHHEEFSRVFRENCEYLGITAGATTNGSGSGASPARPTTVVVGEPSKKSTVKAFVIMPFTERGKDRPEGFFTEVLRSLITPAAVEAGFTVETANRQGSDMIQSTIVNELLEADLVIADLTDHNPNVLFELGLRMAEEKPVALIKAAGTGRVFDVDNMLRVHEYQPHLWRSTVERDLPELTKHIRATWENRNRDHSYMKILRRTGGESNNGARGGGD